MLKMKNNGIEASRKWTVSTEKNRKRQNGNFLVTAALCRCSLATASLDLMRSCTEQISLSLNWWYWPQLELGNSMCVWLCMCEHVNLCIVFINNSTTSGAIELCEGMTSMQRDYFCFPFWWLTKGSGPIHSDISSCTCPLLHISYALDIIKTHWHDI